MLALLALAQAAAQEPSYRDRVDRLFLVTVLICAAFAVLVFVLITVFCWRFRCRPGNEVAQPTKQNRTLEWSWTIGIALIFVAMFYWGAFVYVGERQPPADAYQVYVIGKQWMWELRHPDGRGEINELHVPVGRPVALSMTSEDVIHSFYMPHFRLKADVYPKQYTQLWFVPDKPGRYHLFCAEYCGLNHSRMGGWIHVMPADEFDEWLAHGSTRTLAESGAELFVSRGCVDCHIQGSDERAPSLVGLMGRQVHLEDGSSVVADDNYIRESIMKPRAKVVAGYQPTMPTYKSQLVEDEVVKLLAFLRDLTPESSGTRSGEKR